MSLSLPLTPIQRFDNPAVRPTANFHPNLWGDRFLTYTSDDALAHEQKIEELKEEVRKELKSSAGKSQELLKLIDSIQLLGLAYHFEREIDEALKDTYETYSQLVDYNENLTNTSLRFRLLRQEGCPVSSDVFNKFKDVEGNFKESLIGDLPGLLALYEASYLMVDEEDILEEALAFTTAHLQSLVTDHPNNPLAKQVIHALKRPIRKGLTRVEARHYISIYQEDDSHINKSLLDLAKLDFNLLQSLHRKELSEIYRWWKGLDFARKLPFARDRLVECYFWALGLYFEPQYFLGRKFLTKVIAIISIMDDIYDAYGTIEELESLTEAIERWDVSCIDQLPVQYLKWVYRALLDVYEEMEEEMAKEEKSYRVHYAREAMKMQIRSYFVEAKWLNQGHTPTFNEYLCNALVSSCHVVLITASLVGMGDVVTEEVFQWLLDRPKIIRASEVVGRLMNDIVSHESTRWGEFPEFKWKQYFTRFEQCRMHVPTSVVCYMKQYGVTKQKAYDELNKQIVNAWKDMNKECFVPTQVPMQVINLVLKYVCVEDVVYKDGDEYTHVGKLMQDLIALMLIDPVPI